MIKLFQHVFKLLIIKMLMTVLMLKGFHYLLLLMWLYIYNLNNVIIMNHHFLKKILMKSKLHCFKVITEIEFEHFKMFWFNNL